MKYCRDPRLAGGSDGRLASLEELEGIYDKEANAPGQARLPGPAKGSDFTWHVKGIFSWPEINGAAIRGSMIADILPVMCGNSTSTRGNRTTTRTGWPYHVVLALSRGVARPLCA